MFRFILLLSIVFMSGCNPQSTKQGRGVPVIFDTDIGPDYDDVGAITILHAMEQKGEARILATIASNKYEGIAAVLDVFNTYWGRPDIPIGVPKGQAVEMKDSQHWTDSILEEFPHKTKFNSEVPGAVDVYRKVLADQPDSSVTVVTVGFLTNLENLLKSEPDRFSSLDGRQLVEKKVKVLVSMAGAFPSGREFNMYNDSSASQYVFTHWPTRVIFSGFEIGEKIFTGLPLIQNDSIQNDPAKKVFKISIPQSPSDSVGRMSWDEATTLVAVRGYKPYFTLQEGKIKVQADGSNSWDKDGTGQFYLVQKEAPAKVADVINRLMMEQPVEKQKSR